MSFGKGKLVFDITDAGTIAASDKVGAFVTSSDGTLISHTNVSVGVDALDVYVQNALSIDADGVYDGVTNTNPDNVGAIFHVRNAAPGDAQQTFRSTGGAASSDAVVAANVHGLDSNSFNMVYNGTTWDRLRGTSGNLNVADVSNGAIENTAASVTTTSAAILGSQLASRSQYWIYHNGNKELYIGKSGVTTSNGFPVYPENAMMLRVGASISLHAVASAGTQELRVMEIAA